MKTKRKFNDLDDLYVQNKDKFKFFTKEKLPEVVSKYRKQSIVTTCMNRIEDLKQTFPLNVKNCLQYTNFEFVIVDYNSKDGLEEFIKDNCKNWYESGIIKYVKTTKPQYYSMTHSRNIGFLAATGEIVHSVDADSFVSNTFLDKVNKQAELFPKKAMFTKGIQKLHGRLGFYKKEFIELGGYDESIEGYGFDDRDLWFRALFSGYTLIQYSSEERDISSTRLQTQNNIRIQNFKEKDLSLMGKNNHNYMTEKLLRKEYIANIDKEWGKI